jgi:hypothetical protein
MKTSFSSTYPYLCNYIPIDRSGLKVTINFSAQVNSSGQDQNQTSRIPPQFNCLGKNQKLAEECIINKLINGILTETSDRGSLCRYARRKSFYFLHHVVRCTVYSTEYRCNIGTKSNTHLRKVEVDILKVCMRTTY